MTKLKTFCSNCIYWDIENVRKTASGRIDKKATTRCLYLIELPVLPESALLHGNVCIPKSYMGYHDGQECKCHGRRSDET